MASSLLSRSPLARRRAESSRIAPDLRRVAAFLPRSPVTERSYRRIRAASALLERRVPDGVEVTTLGGVRVRLHTPPGPRAIPGPAVLWIHGGGYVIGNPAQDDAWCRRLVRNHGALVAAVDYRLAPDSPYPAPIDDCHAVLVALAERGDVDPDAIAIAGASAGGGLAAGLAIAARDRGRVSPCFQGLVYPMVDDRTALRTDIDETGFRLWGNRSNAFGWRSYLAREPGCEGVDGAAVPARADDLAGLPPAWIGVGTLDLFLDENLAYAERLRADGVEVDVEVVPGAFHAFDGVAPRSASARGFLGSFDRALAHRLTG